jgi:subtilase family serine protease
MRHRLLVLVLIAGLLTSCVPQVQLGATPEPVVRLPGHVLSALAQATKLDDSAATPLLPDQLTLTRTLNRTDELGFKQFVDDVQNPKSSLYQRFLTQQQLADRFGPSQDAYDAVLTYVQSRGLTLVEGSDNRLTLIVSGTRKQVERAFDAQIGEYDINGRQFYANGDDPQLPVSVAPYVQSVGGLSSLAVPTAAPGEMQGSKAGRQTLTKACASLDVKSAPGLTCAIAKGFLAVVYNLACSLDKKSFSQATLLDCEKQLNSTSQASPAVTFSKLAPGSAPADAGTGQKVGIVAFDSFLASDVADYVALIHDAPSVANQVSLVNINGGAPLGPNQDEVLLDITTILSIVPDATITVYSAPFAGANQSFQPIFNRMLNDGITVISNSWTYCEDQTTLADVQSIDTILASAAASGVSVLNASGDSGSICLDGRPNTIGVPEWPH